MPEVKMTPEQQAARTIAALLPDARQDISVIPILAAKAEVLAKFGALFRPENVEALEVRQFRDFLKFENNKHWTGLDRRLYAAKEIGALRESLADLVDEGEPLARRLDRVMERVPEMTVAIGTAILHVAYPGTYAPWNRFAARALARLRLKPAFAAGAMDGEKYEAANTVLRGLADRTALDLWDLDAVLWYFVAGPTFEEEAEDAEGPRPPLGEILSEVLQLQKYCACQDSKSAMRKRGQLINRVAPKFMAEYINPLRFPSYRLECEGSNGQGNNAGVPYFRIYSKAESPSAALGYYLGYFFAADGSAVYLSLNQGVFEYIDHVNVVRPMREIRERVNHARALLDKQGFRARALKLEIDLRDRKGQIGKAYEEGNVFAIEYNLPLPDEGVLLEDLSEMLDGLSTIYRDKDVSPSADTQPGLAYELPGGGRNVLIRETAPVSPNRPPIAPAYRVQQCAEETGVALDTIASWLRAIERKGQVILYGPPGVGKTFTARRLARAITAETEGFVELVQFHPSYAYEDFIFGIRPTPGAAGTLNLEPVPGRFVDFCRRARGVNGKCVLIIDEINRANLARVFGELMYLLEYREETIELAIGQPFSIPSNVRIIGTMNTADRSIAVVDHALRRRFAFCALTPNYEILRAFHRTSGFPAEGLIALLGKINASIEDPHYYLGISYFMRVNIAEHLQDIWTTEIEPYLEEFFFDQPQIVTSYRWAQVHRQILHG